MEKLPAQMTVVAISKPGGPEVLLPETRGLPAPGPGEILIKLMAAGVNRPDVAQRSGSYPPPPGASDLPGLEVAGAAARRQRCARRWSGGRSRRDRPRRHQAQARRKGDGAGGRWGLRATLHCAG